MAERLRASLGRRHPRRSSEEIAEAFQEAYARALRSCPVEDEPAIYAWLWRTMDNVLVDRVRLLQREAPTSQPDAELYRALDMDADPGRKVERAEEERELAGLFGAVAAELAPRQRAVLALYARGLKRPQLARALGLSQRVVKRDLERVLTRARAALVERCGGGCPEGSRMVWRYAFGLASGRDAAEAQLHLMSCALCQSFLDRLTSWREAAAAAVPVPAAEHAEHGPLERSVHGLADLAGTIRERFGGSGTSLRQHATGGLAQLKQQSASAYARAVDPTPLAGVRPGAAAAAIGACLALGAGATYCVDRGVAPLPSVADLLQQHGARGEQSRRERPAQRAAQVDPAPAPSQQPETTAPAEPAPAPTQPTQPPAVQTPSQTTPAESAPPPEQEQFDPAAAAAAQRAPQPTASRAKPAAAPETGVGEFLGGP